MFEFGLTSPFRVQLLRTPSSAAYRKHYLNLVVTRNVDMKPQEFLKILDKP